MWRDALLMARKDLLVEARSRVAIGQVAPFALLILLLFAFALDQRGLLDASAGLFWVAVLFSAVLAVQRSFAIESADGAQDGLRMSGLDPAGIFFGKTAAVGVQLLALEAVLAVAVVVLYGTQFRGVLLVGATCVIGTAGLAAAGTVYGAASAGLRVRETLLPLLFLPIVSPVLLATTKAFAAALAPAGGQPGPWLGLLGAFAIVYLAIGAVAFGPLMEYS